MAVLLLLAVLVPAALAERRSAATIDPLGTFLESQKLTSMRVETWDTGQRVFKANLPRCPGRIQILAVSALLEDQRFIDPRFPAGSVRTFWYTDKNWTRPDRLQVWSAHLAAEMRNVVRRQPLSNLDVIVETVTPSRCDGIRSIAWQRFWSAAG